MDFCGIFFAQKVQAICPLIVCYAACAISHETVINGRVI